MVGARLVQSGTWHARGQGVLWTGADRDLRDKFRSAIALCGATTLKDIGPRILPTLGAKLFTPMTDVAKSERQYVILRKKNLAAARIEKATSKMRDNKPTGMRSTLAPRRFT